MINSAMAPACLNIRTMIQNQLNCNVQKQMLQQELNYLNSSLYQSSISNVLPIYKNNNEEVEKLIKQINNIIEYEDEKQKILKITAPEVLKKDINADIVIVYGNVSGKIKAKNVVCIKDLCEKKNENIETKLIVPSESDVKKIDYYNNHPDCYHCKFCKTEIYPYPLHCEIKDKNVKKYSRIRARLCKYYESKG